MTMNHRVERTNSTSRRLGRHLSRWQAEFPYHWDADDQVSRRELLRFAVMASGALFAATAGVAALNYLKPLRTVRQQTIVEAASVPLGGVHYFQYPTAEDPALLLHLADGRFVAYSGRCTHLSCAVYYDQESTHVLCPCHEGVFDAQTGAPLAGPPQRSLPKITVHQDGTLVYATEEAPNE